MPEHLLGTESIQPKSEAATPQAWLRNSRVKNGGLVENRKFLRYRQKQGVSTSDLRICALPHTNTNL
jgi:hypothetical protein